MLRVYKIDVSAMSENTLEEFYDRASEYSFLVDAKFNSFTGKMQYIRVFLEENLSIEPLIEDFPGIICTEITGTDLLNT